jgi:hypothetical protein
MAQITITWKAFGDRPESNRFVSSATYELETGDATHQTIADLLYQVTNLQDDLAEFNAPAWKIALWNKIKAGLPINRTHTSLSIGDEISIENIKYELQEFGFDKVGA